MVKIVPTPRFLVDPDVRHQFLLASSDPFTTKPPAQIRGKFSVQLDGDGIVSFALWASDNGRLGDVIAAGVISSRGNPGSVGLIATPASIQPLLLQPSYPFPAVQMATYEVGKTADLFWSIDQPSRTFSLGVFGGGNGANSTTHSGGEPIKQLQLWMWLERPNDRTAVFVDNVKMEEYK